MHETNVKSGRSQNDKLKIKVNSNEHPYPSTDIQKKMLQPRRLTSYFIVFIDSGAVTYQLDLQDMTLTDGNVLFAMPH